MKFNTIQLPWYVYTDRHLVPKDVLDEIQLRDLILDVGGHSWYFFLPPKKYFEKHPEFYPLIGGKRTIFDPDKHAMQICTSNPEVVKAFANNVIAFFNRSCDVRMVTLWANDGWGFCECEDCLAIEPHPDEVEPTSGQKVRSVTYNLFIRKVAEIVGKVFPTKKIEFGAYYNLLPVPKREEVIPDVRNTALFLDYHYVCPCHSLDAPCNKKAIDSEFRKWRKAYRGDIHCVMYYGDNYRIVDLPLGLSERISADIKYIKGLGLNGINSGIYSAPLPYIWEIHGANFYISGKLAWNSNLGIDTILREYFDGYYGSAGQAMLQYYRQWEEITKAYKKHASRILMAHDILTEEDIPKLIERLTEARENARTTLEKSRVMRARRVLAVIELLMEAERKNAGTQRDRRLREICREIDRLTNHTPGLAVKSIITRFSYDTGGHLEKGSLNI